MDEISDTIKGMQHSVDALLAGESEMRSSFHELSQNMKDLSENIKKLNSAFPASDLDGHRRAHELMIESMQDRRRLTQAIKEKTIVALLWSVILFLGLATWNYINDHVIASAIRSLK